MAKEDTVKHPAACLGSAVHRTIEKTYKEKTSPDSTFMIELGTELQNAELELDTKVSDKLIKDGLKMVTQYNYEKRIPDDMEVEFLLPFPNQAHPLCQMRGYIDQVYDEFGFVDLKTNKFKPLMGVLDNDPQFVIYNWAYSEIFNHPPVNSVWHHLRTSEDLYANVAGANKLDDVVRIVEKILDSELTGIWDKTVGKTCEWCNFRMPCLGTDK